MSIIPVFGYIKSLFCDKLVLACAFVGTAFVTPTPHGHLKHRT